MKTLFISLILLFVSCSAFSEGRKELNPSVYLKGGGMNYAGYIFEIDGHKYLLNNSGGILEIKDN